MYNDGLCSFSYTTNLLKDGCLACIGSSYDKNAETFASVLFPEMYDIQVLHIFFRKDCDLVKF